MKRTTIALAVVALILVGVLWWLLLMQPAREEQADLEMQTEQVIAQQAQLRQQIQQLRQVRETAPELEAQLAAAQTLIPREAALPPMLRQLQQAADDAGVRLNSIGAGRPAGVATGEGDELSSIQLTMAAEGTYFQLVDLLRRFEDPAITGRGLLAQSISLSVSETPTLSASITLQAFAIIPPTVAPDDPEAEAEGAETDEEVPEGGDLDEDPALEDAEEPA
jgi:hypothetical protein